MHDHLLQGKRCFLWHAVCPDMSGSNPPAVSTSVHIDASSPAPGQIALCASPKPWDPYSETDWKRIMLQNCLFVQLTWSSDVKQISIRMDACAFKVNKLCFCVQDRVNAFVVLLKIWVILKLLRIAQYRLCVCTTVRGFRGLSNKRQLLEVHCFTPSLSLIVVVR